MAEACTSDSRNLVTESKMIIEDKTKTASRNKKRRNGNISIESKNKVVYFTELRLQT